MAAPRYAIPAALHRVETEVLKSRFIATIERVTSADEARGFVERVRGGFADATHHCWAYVVGPPGSTACIGMSDDGEPHGTAGRPMLNVLLHAPVGDLAVVVTRYFGGTLLGKGGLVRAYSGAVQECLASLATVEHVERVTLSVEIEYAGIDPLRRMLGAHEAEVIAEEFSVTAGYRVRLPATRVEGFRAALLDATSGDALIELLP